MAKTGKFYHTSIVSGSVAGIGTSFDKTKFHVHNLNADVSSALNNGVFQGYIESIFIRVHNIAGGSAAPTITARLCCDANGDYSIMPDTTATLAIGLTNLDSGVAVYEYKLPLRQFFPTDQVWLFIKIDQGTCSMTDTGIFWSE